MATKTQSKTQRNTQSKTQSKRNTDTTNENVDAAAERVRELNERIIESSKKAGNVYLDMYEKTLHSIADYQEKVGKQSDIDWVSTITNAQASFTRDVADAYTSSARSLLK
jgi:hypothetical protein